MRVMQGDESCNLLTQTTNVLRLICGRLHAQLDLADGCLWEVSSQHVQHLQHDVSQLATRIQSAQGVLENLMALRQQQVSASQD